MPPARTDSARPRETHVELEVPFHHVDLLGVVWHGRYFEYFEQARTKLLRGCRLDAGDLIGQRYGLFVIESKCRHSFPLFYGDRFRVAAWLRDIQHRICIRYEITNLTRDDRRAARALRSSPRPTWSETCSWKPRMRSDVAFSSSLIAIAVLASAVGLARATADDSQAGFDLPALMQRMATTSGVIANFRESKELALLSQPLESRGVLYFAPPDRLARFTLEPAYSSLVVDGEALRFRDGQQGEEFDLSSNPMARTFVDNFIVLFNGDLESLEERYQTALSHSGGGDSWSLVLTPRRAPLDAIIERITLTGDRSGIREMVMRAADGDRTSTRLDSVDADHRFSAPEIDTLFSKRVPLSAQVQ